MGWRLRIAHTTEITYAGLVRASFNEARMTPLTLPTQATLQACVTVGSGAVPTWVYTDYWGTRVTAFDLMEAHDELLIRATATVETSAPAPRVPMSWEAVRETAAGSRLFEYRMPTPLTALSRDIADDVLADVTGMSAHEAAEMISDRVRDRVTFMPGATGVRTGAQEAWHKGKGVCQDMAHVTVGLLRTAGLPARYVSGYLHPDVNAEPGRIATGQSHAWVEYWAGDWFPLDPTSGAPVADRHVVVARGRDYGDVPPLKGIYRGPGDSLMNVTVDVTRLA